MGNVLNSLKRFLSNKNTVTIIGILLGVVVIYFFYNWRVNQAITPITIPYAREELPSRTLITEDVIGYMQVPTSMVRQNQTNIVQSARDILDKYVSYGTTVPAGSPFYKSQILDSDDMPDSAFADIPDGYTIFSLSVTLHTTYGNSIFPGNYIDLYFKGVDDAQKVMFGKLIESIKVLAVKDNEGRHVFESTIENRTPSVLLFAVPDDMFKILELAGYINANVEIKPVPRNASYSANPGETLVSSETIREFILSKSAILPEDESIISNENIGQ